MECASNQRGMGPTKNDLHLHVQASPQVFQYKNHMNPWPPLEPISLSQKEEERQESLASLQEDCWVLEESDFRNERQEKPIV